jgi:hypothetical protein
MSKVIAARSFQDIPRRRKTGVEELTELLLTIYVDAARDIELALAGTIFFGLGFAIAMRM